MTRSILLVFLIGCTGTNGGDRKGPERLHHPDRSVEPTHDGTTATVHLEVHVAGPGRITSEPPGIDCGGGGTACAMERTGDVTLHTSTDTTVRWGGACAGNGSCAVVGDDDVTVSALTFAP